MHSRLVRPALFTSTADASVLRDRARQLPYDRESLAPGEVLPIRDEPFLRALLGARSIHFDGRETSLGDALLALSHLEAICDAALLLGLRLTVTASPEIARLLEVPASARPPDQAVRITLAPGYTDPLMPRADLPAFRTAARVYADLPARRYLDVERRLGLRLPRNGDFLPTLKGRPCDGRGQPLICYIAASAWPRKKDYGIRRFALVAQHIHRITGRDFDHVLIQGLDTRQKTPPPLMTLPFESHDMPALAGLFAQATLIIGNDTGLVHAAAMTKSQTRLGVIGIYGRHSYLRLTTGHRRHYAIATPFAQAMALGDCAPIRDGIDDEWYPRAAAVRRLAPEYIAECAIRVLEG
jgi:hypothetical protein